jgi:hypothetical protein
MKGGQSILLPDDHEESAAPEVLCINCERYLDVDEIDQHSKHCFMMTKAVSDEDSSPSLVLSRMKLERLRLLLEKLALKAKALREKNYIVIMIRLCNQAVAVQQLSEVEEIEKHLNSLDSSALRDKSSISTVLCSDRLKALIELYKAALRPSVDDDQQAKLRSLQAELRGYQSLTQRLELELSSFSKAKLDQVNSEVASEYSGMQSSLSQYNEDFEVPISAYRDLQSTTTQDEHRRLFYSACLTLKMSFPSGHPARKVPIAKLYSKSLQDGVSMDRWRPYIKEWFANLGSSQRKLAYGAGIREITESEEQDDVSYVT